MASKNEPIEDYYGAELDVEQVMASPGPMVDLDFDGPSEDRGFFRLTHAQAIELGQRLIAAGEERDG